MVTTHCRDAKRRGFTMIELIFAIVIMALVVITIPTILVSNARHVERNLLHEAVLIATAKMGQTLSYPWDENSALAGVLSKTEALNVTTGDIELRRVTFSATDANLSDFRAGHFREPMHRRMTPPYGPAVRSVTSVAGLGADGGDFDDIDDIINHPDTITDTDEYGYKNSYTVTGSAAYVSDSATYTANSVTFNFNPTAVSSPTNIKMVEINVNDSSTGNTIVLFRAFSSNIGETDYYKRTY